MFKKGDKVIRKEGRRGKNENSWVKEGVPIIFTVEKDNGYVLTLTGNSLWSSSGFELYKEDKSKGLYVRKIEHIDSSKFLENTSITITSSGNVSPRYMEAISEISYVGSSTVNKEGNILKINNKNNMSEFNKKITSEFFNDNKNIKSIKDTKEILTSIYENINKSMSDIEKKKSKLTTLLQQFNQAVGDDNVDDIKRYLETYKDYIDYLTKYLNTSLKDIAPFKQVTTVTAEEYFK